MTAAADATEQTAAPAAQEARSPSGDAAGVSFRQRLVEGMAASVRERGYRETTVADIVRHARTSRRTFYAEFSSKDDCYIALLYATHAQMRRYIEATVDQTAPWQRQVRQAVEAYIEAAASEPAIMLSWIRELPALGTVARTVQREAIDLLTEMLLRLTDTEVFRAAGAGPLTRPLALLLLGGIRELTAMTLEDGGEIHQITEVVTAAATALLTPVG